MDEILVTQEQYDALRKQLAEAEARLEDARRRIGEAASYGDLSENSEYDAAREDEQLFLSMVMQLREKVSSCRVMTEPVQSVEGEVVIGSKVKVLDLDKDKEFEYILVGGGDYDFAKGEIPYTGPLGQALQGAKVGETVEVEIGTKTRLLKILDVS